MKKTIIFLLIISYQTGISQYSDIMNNTIYQFTVNDIEGNEFDFQKLEGKKIMVVNTASKCGLTPQYKGLQELYDKYKDSGFVIVGFPANNFLWQEPGTETEIKKFLRKKLWGNFSHDE